MPSYSYTAVSDMGKMVRGTITADNDLDLESRLKHNGFELVSFRAARERKGKSGKVKIKELILLCLHLEQLDKAGVPLHEALADMRDSADSARLKDLLTSIYESVKNGSMLSVAMAQHPKTFNNVFVGLVAAGEKTGKLSEAFEHLSHHLKWTNELRRKVKKAIRYPMGVLTMMTIAISVLMTAVVPKLVSFIVGQGFSIPLHTRALIATSDAFVEYWYLILGTPIVLVVTIVFFYRKSDDFAYKIDAITLRMPVIGSVVRKIDAARFTHFFAVMFNSGIDILESINAGQGVVKNRVIKESIEQVKRDVTEGSSLTNAMKASNQFPNLVVRMFKVGEDSGNMKDALENVNFFYDREVNDSVDNMVGMIQPLLTVFLGLILFWIIAAMFGPLYQSLSKMNI